jgi:hypothetical protein
MEEAPLTSEFIDAHAPPSTGDHPAKLDLEQNGDGTEPKTKKVETPRLTTAEKRRYYRWRKRR